MVDVSRLTFWHKLGHWPLVGLFFIGNGSDRSHGKQITREHWTLNVRARSCTVTWITAFVFIYGTYAFLFFVSKDPMQNLSEKSNRIRGEKERVERREKFCSHCWWVLATGSVPIIQHEHKLFGTCVFWGSKKFPLLNKFELFSDQLSCHFRQF